MSKPGSRVGQLSNIELSGRAWVHSVSLHLTTPFLRWNGLAPALVAVEVESHGRRGVRRDW